MSNRADFKYEGNVNLSKNFLNKKNIQLGHRDIKDLKIKNISVLTPIKIDLEADGVSESVYGNMDFINKKVYVSGYIGDIDQLSNAVFNHMNVEMDEAVYAAPPEYMEMAEQMRKDQEKESYEQ